MSDGQQSYGRGVIFYCTPGHGGIHVSKKLNKRIPDYMKDAAFGGLGHKGWYEEDCDWAIVVVCLAIVATLTFGDKQIADAHELLKSHKPVEYAQFMAEQTRYAGSTVVTPEIRLAKALESL